MLMCFTPKEAILSSGPIDSTQSVFGTSWVDGGNCNASSLLVRGLCTPPTKSLGNAYFEAQRPQNRGIANKRLLPRPLFVF